MKETLETINQMQADGVISHYAIGGAVGATFYLRILQFIEQDAVDMEVLQGILESHGLTAKWKQFQRRFLEGING